MTEINDILKPKTKQEVRDVLKDMQTYEFLAAFRKKSLLFYRGMGLKKRVLHAFLKLADQSMRIIGFLLFWMLAGTIWNFIFPWSPMWEFSFMETALVLSAFSLMVLFPFIIFGWVIKYRTDKYELENLFKLLDLPPYFMHIR